MACHHKLITHLITHRHISLNSSLWCAVRHSPATSLNNGTNTLVNTGSCMSVRAPFRADAKSCTQTGCSPDISNNSSSQRRWRILRTRNRLPLFRKTPSVLRSVKKRKAANYTLKYNAYTLAPLLLLHLLLHWSVSGKLFSLVLTFLCVDEVDQCVYVPPAGAITISITITISLPRLDIRLCSTQYTTYK